MRKGQIIGGLKTGYRKSDLVDGQSRITVSRCQNGKAMIMSKGLKKMVPFQDIKSEIHQT